jgi:hypothetical protein
MIAEFAGEGRTNCENPKSEYRNPKQIRMTKSRNSKLEYPPAMQHAHGQNNNRVIVLTFRDGDKSTHRHCGQVEILNKFE